MDNNYSRPNRKRKRPSKKVAQRRRMIALAVIVGILIIGLILIISACSSCSSDDNSGKTPAPVVTTQVTTTMPVITTPVVTTTAPPVTGDPNDPNTITAIELDKYEVFVEVGESDMPWVTMFPEASPEKGELWTSSNEAVATVDHIGNITGVSAGECYVTVTSKNNPVVYAEVKVVVTDPNAVGTPTNTTTDLSGGLQQTASATGTTTAASPALSGDAAVEVIDGITYVDGILIANKSYGLPSSYNPGGLLPEASSAFDKLSQAAAAEGLNIYNSSGFRSYEYQSQIYSNYSNIYGSATADTFSARPGHSEHQTGLAIDVNSIDDSFAGTPEAIWLENHAHEYGFIIRYPKGKQDITGYKYEPWHIRYLGIDTATKVYNSGLTLEEYLRIDSVYAN